MSFYVKNNRIINNKIYYKNHTIDKNIIPNHINNSTIARLANKNPSTDIS